MRKAVQFALVIWALVSFMTCTSPAQAIRVAKVQAISPDASVSSLSITASPSSVSFGLVSKGIAQGSSAINITTKWGGSLCIYSCTVNLYAYFSTAAAALSGGGSPVVNIPTSEVLGEMPTGLPTTYTAFTQSNPLGGAGASLELFTQSFTLYTGGGSRTDSLNLEINLANQPQLPAGSYSGTLYIQAQSL